MGCSGGWWWVVFLRMRITARDKFYLSDPSVWHVTHLTNKHLFFFQLSWISPFEAPGLFPVPWLRRTCIPYFTYCHWTSEVCGVPDVWNYFPPLNLSHVYLTVRPAERNFEGWRKPFPTYSCISAPSHMARPPPLISTSCLWLCSKQGMGSMGHPSEDDPRVWSQGDGEDGALGPDDSGLPSSHCGHLPNTQLLYHLPIYDSHLMEKALRWGERKTE